MATTTTTTPPTVGVDTCLEWLWMVAIIGK